MRSGWHRGWRRVGRLSQSCEQRSEWSILSVQFEVLIIIIRAAGSAAVQTISCSLVFHKSVMMLLVIMEHHQVSFFVCATQGLEASVFLPCALNKIFMRSNFFFFCNIQHRNAQCDRSIFFISCHWNNIFLTLAIKGLCLKISLKIKGSDVLIVATFWSLTLVRGKLSEIIKVQ